MDKNLLTQMLSGRVVIACVGNQLRGDDGVGPFISGLVKSTDRIRVVNCGETPENYLGVIAGYRPEKVIIIDAAHFGGEPGDVRIVKKDDITGGGLSTHDAILTLFANYIEAEAGAETFFLAIQPKRSEVGGTLSPRVEHVAKEIAAAVNEIILDSA
jgi:hydrogenase 3 maturation protease